MRDCSCQHSDYIAVWTSFILNCIRSWTPNNFIFFLWSAETWTWSIIIFLLNLTELSKILVIGWKTSNCCTFMFISTWMDMQSKIHGRRLCLNQSKLKQLFACLSMQKKKKTKPLQCFIHFFKWFIHFFPIYLIWVTIWENKSI